MTVLLRWVGLTLVMAGFAVFIGYFSDSPPYRHFPADQALIRLSFVHGARREVCRKLSAAEIQRLPPNMRRTELCERLRRSLEVELTVDNAVIYRDSLPPSGIGGDGPSRVYRRFPVAPGSHSIMARLRDTDRAEGFDYEDKATVVLAPGQSLVVDFHADGGHFTFR